MISEKNYKMSQYEAELDFTRLKFTKPLCVRVSRKVLGEKIRHTHPTGRGFLKGEPWLYVIVTYAILVTLKKVISQLLRNIFSSF